MNRKAVLLLVMFWQFGGQSFWYHRNGKVFSYMEIGYCTERLPTEYRSCMGICFVLITEQQPICGLWLMASRRFIGLQCQWIPKTAGSGCVCSHKVCWGLQAVRLWIELYPVLIWKEEIDAWFTVIVLSDSRFIVPFLKCVSNENCMQSGE